MKYSVRAGTTLFGGAEEAGDAGEGVEVVEKNIYGWSWYVGMDERIQMEANGGCRGSSERVLRWGCRLGLRGLLRGGYTWKGDVLQTPLVGFDHAGQTKGY